MYSLIPLLAALPATYGAAAATWWKPTHADTFLYDADRIAIESPVVTTNTDLLLNKNVYIVDMEGHTAADIAQYKKDGKKVVCYISAGTWEPWRDDASDFLPACFCGAGTTKLNSEGLCPNNNNKMYDPASPPEEQWNEWWLDVRTSSCITNVQKVMAARIQAAKNKGCDAVDPDNMDGYANKVLRSGGKTVVPHGLTMTNQVNYLKWWAGEAHRQGMAIGLKNAGNLLMKDGKAGQYQQDLVNLFDFNVIEACTQYNECEIYDSMLNAGKPQIRVEYDSLVTECPAKQSGVTFSVYSSYVLNTLDINLDCV